MKQPKISGQAHAAGNPPEARQFPLSAQANPTASREKVREVAYPVRAPRETKRRVERKSKSQTGT